MNVKSASWAPLPGTLSQLAYAFAVAALMTPAPAGAQVQGGRLQATRAELEELVAAANQRLTSGSESERTAAREQIARVQQRLSDGDFQIGDRVILEVEGHPQLSDTFAISAGRALVLPEVGEIPLSGLLRSELTGHLTTTIGRFIRSPVVRARALVRLEVMGSVGRPGFYLVPADMPLADVLMQAGGPSNESALDRMRVLRGGVSVIPRDTMRLAIVEGRTIDQLDVRAGDRLEVPVRRSRSSLLRDALVVASGVASVVFLIRSVR